MLRSGSKKTFLEQQNDKTGLVGKFLLKSKYKFYVKTGLSYNSLNIIFRFKFFWIIIHASVAK